MSGWQSGHGACFLRLHACLGGLKSAAIKLCKIAMVSYCVIVTLNAPPHWPREREGETHQQLNTIRTVGLECIFSAYAALILLRTGSPRANLRVSLVVEAKCQHDFHEARFSRPEYGFGAWRDIQEALSNLGL